ncbi:MAG: hypothetical protein IPN22_12365 [Bacteroidetes bacterium]|nr:hypothetical protein [Bacteroidota bacterium]
MGDIFIALGIEIVVVFIYILYFVFILNQSWANIWWVWTAEWVYWIAMLAGSLLFFRYKQLRLV